MSRLVKSKILAEENFKIFDVLKELRIRIFDSCGMKASKIDFMFQIEYILTNVSYSKDIEGTTWCYKILTNLLIN